MSRSVEVKNADSITYLDCSTFALAGLVANLSPVAQGVLATQRVGEKIHAKRCRINFNMNLANASNFTYRFILLKDTDGTSTLPVATAIYTSARTTALMIDDVKPRYKVLHDKIVDCNVNFTNQDFRATHVIDVPLDFPIFYNGAGSGDLEKNSILLVVLAEMGSTTQYTALTGNEAFLGLYGRLEFTDL